MSGGGPLDERIARRFLGFGLPLLQGYGLTEASPVVSGNLAENNAPESVGPPLPGVQVRVAEAGKPVYVEKPMARNHEECRRMIEACRNAGVPLWVAYYRRQLPKFVKIKELVEGGAIGPVREVHTWCNKSWSNGRFKFGSPPPEQLDWNLWQGPAAYRDYSKNRTGFWQWRNISLYSKGAILDMGTHLVDTAQLAINDPLVCPVEVKAWGQEIPPDSESDIPALYDVQYRYSNGIVLDICDPLVDAEAGIHKSIHMR